MLEKELYLKAIEAWGKTAQIDMVIEEMAELTHALCKSKRNTKPKGWKCDIYEEMADVEIMLDQLKIIFDCELLVQIHKECKLERLEKRLKSRDVEDTPVE